MKTIISIAIGILFTGISVFCQSTISYEYDKHGRLTAEEYESVYKVQLRYDKEGNFISKTITNYTGISSSDSPETDKGYKLYPNPAEDKVIIEVQGIYDIKNIRVYDISGRIVRSIDDPGYIIEIPVNDLFSSVYVVKIEAKGKTEVMKFIKR